MEEAEADADPACADPVEAVDDPVGAGAQNVPVLEGEPVGQEAARLDCRDIHVPGLVHF